MSLAEGLFVGCEGFSGSVIFFLVGTFSVVEEFNVGETGFGPVVDFFDEVEVEGFGLVPVSGGDGGVGGFEVETIVGAALGGHFGFGGVEFFSFSGVFGLDSLIVGESTLDSFFAGGDAEKFFQFGLDFAGLVTGLGGFDEALERGEEGVAFGGGLVGEVFAFLPIVGELGIVFDAVEFGIVVFVDSSGAVQADGVDSGLIEGALNDGFG